MSSSSELPSYSTLAGGAVSDSAPSFSRAVEEMTSRSARIRLWSEEVEEEEELGAAGLQQEVPAGGATLKLTRVDYGMARTDVPPQERLQQQHGLRSTTLLRTSASRRMVPCRATEISRTCAGVPYGPGVRALGWTKGEMKVASPVLDAVASSLIRALLAGTGEAVLASGTTLSVWEWPEQNLFSVVDGFRWYCVMLRSRRGNALRLMVQMDDGHVLDIAGHDALGEVRDTDPGLHGDLLVVLAALQLAFISHELRASYHLLQDASLAAMRAATVVGARSARDGGTYSGGGPHHALWSEGAYLSDDLVQDRRVPTAYYDASLELVSYGLVSAGDVAPTLLVLLGSNGGKAVTGSVLVVRNLDSGGFFTAVTAATANTKPEALEKAVKLGALVRDGLFSPACVGALGSARAGVVNAVVDGRALEVRTLLEDLDPERPLVVSDRDPYRLYEYVWDLCGVMGWTAEGADGYTISVSSGSLHLGDVAVRYGARTGPRWAQLLKRLPRETRRHVMSPELLMDYGASGLGRYLLREHISCGRFVGFKKLTLHTEGYFSEAALSIVAPSPDRPAARLPTSYVLDTEYLTRKLEDGTVERYVYAVGLAKFYDGRYIGSSLVMDDSPELAEFLRDNESLAGTKAMSMLASLRASVLARNRATLYAGNPSELLREVRRAARHPDVRVYAKGADAERELLASTLVRATRLFRRAGNTPPVRMYELGAFVPRYELLAGKHGWERVHDPAREAVLFGFEAGLATELPMEGVVGLDDAVTLLPAVAEQVV
ncbi:P4 [Setosphaeria turcica chrysovirus 1]|nr:P4 [Setosphaeria turcica chrysovirus 1]